MAPWRWGRGEMRIRPSQLETLLWIERLGRFRAAAEQLKVTQPAVSMRMRELERVVGTPLFLRDKQRVRLTPRGRELVAYAERVMALSREAERMLMAPRRLSGQVRIGVADSYALTALPDVLLEIERRHPEVRIEIDVDFSAKLDRRLARGELDIAVLTAPTPGPAIRAEPLVDLRLRWVAGRRIHLPSGAVTPRLLREQPILTNPAPSHLYTTIRSWFATAGIEPQRLNTCSSLTVMARLAAAGFGVSLLPIDVFGAEIAAGDLRVLRSTPSIPAHRITVAYRLDADQDLSALAKLMRGTRGKRPST